MSKNGTAYKHGDTVGYIVQMGGSSTRVGTVCYGVENPNKPTFLGGNPATLFKTRKDAECVIRAAKSQPTNEGMTYTIIRVAPLAARWW